MGKRPAVQICVHTRPLQWRPVAKGYAPGVTLVKTGLLRPALELLEGPCHKLWIVVTDEAHILNAACVCLLQRFILDFISRPDTDR